ncbi:flagellar FliJ family protein [Nesterenkonia pannonica]|uniref:flagellar FliJ family protein n=1 Tax=Nesterenkonia pannonica TaxID=1548602 RepID=UPI0021649AF3|nr:flagellar FliJ family protein [Nesterenkonia pannonica]
MAAAFSLAGLLRLRSLREADAAGRLFTAHEKTQRANQRLEKFRVQAAQSEAPQGPPESLLAVAAARSSSRSMLDELRAYAEQASSDQEQAEWDYRSARQDVKVVEKLQARHDQRLAHERLAAEQAALDEAGQRRSLREEGPR